LIRRFKKTAFTLIELLVVISVIALLLSILAPSLTKAKRSVKSLLSAKNQKDIVTGLSCYTVDNNERYPATVATIGVGNRWSWREPTLITGYQKRNTQDHRSVAAYLNSYIETASTMFCPSSPSKYKYAQQAWLAGDEWDNPSPGTGSLDPLDGNYCLLWNYTGYLEDRSYPFIGPRSTTQKARESKLLICDYFGYGHWRNEFTYGSRDAFGSCEKLNTSDKTEGTAVSSEFWSKFNASEEIDLDSIEVKLKAGFTDGHVETYSTSDVINMKISMKQDGSQPYPDNVSPGGVFFIPGNSW